STVQLRAKPGERLAGAGRRANEGGLALRDRRPSLLLRRARRTEGVAKPVANDRMEGIQRGHGRKVVTGRHWPPITSHCYIATGCVNVRRSDAPSGRQPS